MNNLPNNNIQVGNQMSRQTLRVSAVALPRIGAAKSDILIVTDESSSMSESCLGGTTRMAAAKAAAAGFANVKSKLDPMGRVGIMGFSDSVRIVLPFTSASELPKIRNATDSLSERGGTDITAGLLEAHRVFSANEVGGSRFVLLLTDGQHQGTEDPVAAADGLKRIGVEIFAVGFASTASEVDPRLPQIASSGKYLFCDSLDQLLKQFENISQRTSIRQSHNQ
jgi:Mg-chelatase subunit ChlD